MNEIKKVSILELQSQNLPNRSFSAGKKSIEQLMREGYLCSERHWYRDRGKAAVGKPLPNCIRCGAPNPRFKGE